MMVGGQQVMLNSDWLRIVNKDELFGVIGLENSHRNYEIGSYINTEHPILCETLEIPVKGDIRDGFARVEIQDNVITLLELYPTRDMKPNNSNKNLGQFISTISNTKFFNMIKNWHDYLFTYVIPKIDEVDKTNNPIEIKILDEVYNVLGINRGRGLNYRLPSPLHIFSPSQFYYEFLLTNYIQETTQLNVLYSMSKLHLGHLITTIDVFSNTTCPAIVDSKCHDIIDSWQPYIDILVPWFAETRIVWNYIKKTVQSKLQEHMTYEAPGKYSTKDERSVVEEVHDVHVKDNIGLISKTT